MPSADVDKQKLITGACRYTLAGNNAIYQLFRMPSRSEKVIAVLQRATVTVPSNVNWKPAVVGLDDLSIAFKTVGTTRSTMSKYSSS